MKHPPHIFYEVRSEQWPGVTFAPLHDNPNSLQSSVKHARKLSRSKAYRGHRFYVVKVIKTFRVVKRIKRKAKR